MARPLAQQKINVRSVPFSSRRLQDLTDVNTSKLDDGSVLVYNKADEKFESTLNIDKNQNINGGHY
jgi:hypothetical protein